MTAEISSINLTCSDFVAKSALECSLELAHQLSKKEPIPDKMCETVLALVAEADPVEVINLLIRFPSPLIPEILVAACSTLPAEVNEYLYIGTDTKIDQPTVFLTGKGIDLFIQSCTLPTDAKIYPTLWIGNLATHISVFLDSKEQKGAFFVNHSKRLRGHVTALYMEKSDAGKLRIFISDSLGEEGNGITAPFEVPIIQVLAAFATHIEKIFIMKPKRQQSGVGCITFAITDIIEILKCTDFFATLQMEGKIEGKGMFQNVLYPPACLMKLTHSFTLLKPLIDDNPLLSATETPFLSHESMPFSVFLEKASFFENLERLPKKRNFYSTVVFSRIIAFITKAAQ